MSRLPHPAPAPATDARLLTIAAEHLRRLGPRRVTVVGIAQAAGMTHANVYRYFSSKTALIDAVAAQWLRRLELGLAEIADAPDPADDKLERLLVAIAQGNRGLLARDRHLFEVYAAAAETSRGFVRKHRPGPGSRRAGHRRGHRDGRLRAAQPRSRHRVRVRRRASLHQSGRRARRRRHASGDVRRAPRRHDPGHPARARGWWVIE